MRAMVTLLNNWISLTFETRVFAELRDLGQISLLPRFCNFVSKAQFK